MLIVGGLTPALSGLAMSPRHQSVKSASVVTSTIAGALITPPAAYASQLGGIARVVKQKPPITGAFLFNCLNIVYNVRNITYIRAHYGK